MEGVGHAVIANVPCLPYHLGGRMRRLCSRPLRRIQTPPHARACAPRGKLKQTCQSTPAESSGFTYRRSRRLFEMSLSVHDSSSIRANLTDMLRNSSSSAMRSAFELYKVMRDCMACLVTSLAFSTSSQFGYDLLLVLLDVSFRVYPSPLG